jgi:hypothetical protein
MSQARFRTTFRFIAIPDTLAATTLPAAGA